METQVETQAGHLKDSPYRYRLSRMEKSQHLHQHIPHHIPETSFMSRMIMSGSGWRGIFDPFGNPEGRGKNISGEARDFCIRATHSFIRFLATFSQRNNPLRILLAQDSRPTGEAIRTTVAETARACGVHIEDAGIRCIPEVLAASESPLSKAGYSNAGYDGVIYITASHNPVGYNGFKFGRHGSVISRDLEQKLRALFHENIPMKSMIESILLQKDENDLPPEMEANHCRADSDIMSGDLIRDAYELRILTCASHSTEPAVQNQFLKEIRRGMEDNPLGLIVDMNGSARATSIDNDILTRAGAHVHVLNGTPGAIIHGIIPEGSHMETCRQTLETMHKQDARWQLAYMPDNDGDRGNMACIDSEGTAQILTAQELFSLVVLSELAAPSLTASLSTSLGTSLTTDSKTYPQAVVVNCATSLRIDRLCSLFGVRVARAEVGEANGTSLASKLKEEGYHVRIMGEGSNGGCIIPPSQVRDPLTALFSLLRLLRSHGLKTPASEYARRAGVTLPYAPTVQDFLECLPIFQTTGSTDPQAMIHASIPDYDRFKTAYERAFLSSWPLQRQWLSKAGITHWREEQTEGTQMRTGMGTEYRNHPFTGSLKIVFMDAVGRDQAFMWMRPSSTEPVFRLVIDCSAEAGGARTYNQLMRWHRDLVETALKEA